MVRGQFSGVGSLPGMELGSPGLAAFIYPVSHLISPVPTLDRMSTYRAKETKPRYVLVCG